MNRAERNRRPPRRSLGARLGVLAGEVVAGLLALVIVAALAAYVRLAEGPIALERLRPMVEARVAEVLPDMRLDFTTAEIALGRGGRARLQVRDAALFDAADQPVLRAPLIAASFRLTDLARARYLPTDVVIEGVGARLVRAESGVFSFGFGGETAGEIADGAGAEMFSRLLAASVAEKPDAAEGAAAPPTSARLLLRGASLLYLDRMSGRAWRARDLDLSFQQTEAGMQARTTARLTGGRYGDMTLEVNGYRAPGGDIHLSALIDNAAPRDIADQLPALDWLAAFDAPVDGRMQVAVDPAGNLLSLGGRLEASAGAVTLGGGVTEPLTSAALAFEFEPETQRFRIDEASLDSPRVFASGAGFVEIGRDAAGVPVDAVVQLDLTDISGDAPEVFFAPISYEHARVTGRVTFEPFLVEIGELRLEDGPLYVSAAGSIEVQGGETRADVALSGGGMTVADLLSHWPRMAAPGAREWMLANMEGGDITDFDASLRIGGDADAVKFDFTFENAEGRYLDPMPPIINGAGAGQVDLKRFALKLDSGQVALEDGGTLEVGGSTFVIPDLDHPDTPADIDLRATASLADALAIVDHAPLGFISRLDLPLDGVKGRVNVVTKVTIPLLKNLRLEDVKASAVADIADFRIDSPDLGGVVAAKALRLEADTSKFSLSGRASLDGLAADVSWREVFATGARDVSLRARVTPKALTGLGLDAPWFQGGAAAVKAQVAFRDAGPALKVSADLKAAELRVDEIGWTKPAGEAADVSARVIFEDDAIRAPAYALTSRDLKLEGNVLLSASGELQRIKLKRLRYRGGADVAVTGRRGDERWNVKVEGPLLDLTRFPDLIEGGEAGRGAPLRLNLDIARLQLRPSVYLAAASGQFVVSRNRRVKGRLTGSVENEAPFELKVDSGPEGGEVTVTTQNAGRLLRASGAFDDGSGGTLMVTAQIADTRDLQFSGVAKLRDIIVHKDAKLEQLLAGADLEDLREKMRKDGIEFSRISLPFTYEGGKLSTKSAVAIGPSIGVNITGDYALEEDNLDIDGVFTPVYTLNAAIGKIPLLGDLLTGGEGQGLFAFNFSVKGPAADPDIAVNPLSVLTPGVFRRIFTMEGDPASSEIWIKDRMDADH